jgi:hypothetical protein
MCGIYIYIYMYSACMWMFLVTNLFSYYEQDIYFGCFQADMNSKKIIHCLAKINLHLTLIGSRLNFMVALNSG